MFQRVRIELDSFAPKLLSFAYFESAKQQYGKKLRTRMVEHYEIDFFTKTGGGVFADSIYYPITEGMLHFRRPGEVFQGVLGYNCYSLCFDIVPSKEYVIKYTNPVLDTIGKVVTPDSTEEYMVLFEEISKEYTHLNPASPLYIESAILKLIYKLYRDTLSSIDAKLKNAYHGVIKKAVRFIEESYQKDISVTEIADHVELSPNYFHKVFVNTIGTTPAKYLNSVRMEKAKKLLCQTQNTIREVASLCGFENDAYFCQVFRKEAGITPAQYRKKFR